MNPEWGKDPEINDVIQNHDFRAIKKRINVLLNWAYNIGYYEGSWNGPSGEEEDEKSPADKPA